MIELIRNTSCIRINHVFRNTTKNTFKNTFSIVISVKYDKNLRYFGIDVLCRLYF